MKLGGKTYEFVRGSDVQRDGMYIEVADVTNGAPKIVAEVFYSDETHRMTFTAFEPDIPFEILEHLYVSARKSLTPVDKLAAQGASS